ncbi:DNA polymerase III subunit gamma/tau [Arenibacter sp. GZD96]|uniref:DNA polymerase III subunit gamma/tau n=1 Tax=Aurantibrevibacter litoralis TaxID=3106030 RepID=UPI002AFF0260|nr:DNA polymerase III subunit gamma/tau [Arenibacter sp. GZD-96]MEA1784923.1 DNA polymerase III subunit gamma/tau [Arenibacter sp. GZD-96]
MEPFVVSALKYRPQTFTDVVGQQAITNTLLNAIEHNHLAQALLFCGPRGVGKTTCARILAKKINQDGQEHPEEDFAFNIFELDAASNNSVDDIRSLTDQVRIPPQVGKYKVYIIDEVHMLSAAAFNAFLKTLEEPPKHAIFILATTEKHKIIPTILSRCQIFDFKRITVKDAAEYLKYIAENQGIEAEEAALHIIAQKADGAMRDALSIFDRVVSYSGTKLTRKAVTENLNVLDYDTYFETTNLILANDIPALFLLLNETLAKGFDGHHFITGLASHFRDLMVCQYKDTISLLEVGSETQNTYLEQAAKTSAEFLLKALDIANDCDLKYKTSKNQRLLVELTLMKLASLTFEGEKKNPKPIGRYQGNTEFIIPASHYKIPSATKSSVSQKASTGGNGVPKNDTYLSKENRIPENVTVPLISHAEKPIPSASPKVTNSEALPHKEKNTPVQHPNMPVAHQRISGLSLSSLKAKKEHHLSKIEVIVEEDNLPNSPFSEVDMQHYWAEFVEKLETDGRKILASNLHADVPKLLDKTTIWIELPNSTMKKEVEREHHDLMVFLKEKLHNHFLKLKISVNEETMQKYAFTPEEKYQKLREMNPNIDVLKKEFDLDL